MCAASDAILAIAVGDDPEMDQLCRRPAPDTESMERAPYSEPVLELNKVYATAVSLLPLSHSHPPEVRKLELPAGEVRLCPL